MQPTQNQYAEFYDFTGGVNKRTSPVKLRDNELSDAQNIIPSTRGAIARRYGFVAYNDTEALIAGDDPFASNQIVGLLRFYREAVGEDDLIVAACAGRILSVPASGDSTNLGDSIDFLYDEGAAVNMVQYHDRVYGTAWGDVNKRMFVVGEDPNTSTDLMLMTWGLAAPTDAPVTAARNDGNSLAGHYKYKYAYVYGESGGRGESEPSPESTDLNVTGANDTARVTLFGGTGQYATQAAALDAGIDQVYIYRTLNLTDYPGSDFYYLDVVTLADGGALYYDDDGSDDDFDTFTVPMFDVAIPNGAKYACVFQERAFIANLYDGTDYFPKRVRWSIAGMPDGFQANAFADTPADQGDIMGLFTLNGSLFVAFESGIGKLAVYSDTDASFEMVTETAGVKAPRSIAIGEDGGVPCAFFLGFDHQVYRFDGFGARAISEDISTVLTSEGNQSCMQTCAGGWDGEYYRLSFPNGTSTVPSAELRYSSRVRKMNELLGYDIGTWWPQVYPSGKAPNVYVRLDGGEDRGEIYWGNSGDAGYVYIADSGNDDDGSAIASYAFTGYATLGTANYQKRLDRLLVDVLSWTQLTARWDMDWNAKTGKFLVPSQTERPEYDKGLMYDAGHFYIGDAPTRTRYNFDGHLEGLRFRMKISAIESGEPYVVYGWTVGYGLVRED